MACMVADIAAAELDAVHERIAGRFARAEPRARVREYLSGLVAGLERKNGWTLAERAGEVSPDGMQRLLRHADWDTREVRDDMRDYVIENLGDPGGVLIADETGFIKKGTRSAGVQRHVPRPANSAAAKADAECNGFADANARSAVREHALARNRSGGRGRPRRSGGRYGHESEAVLRWRSRRRRLEVDQRRDKRGIPVLQSRAVSAIGAVDDRTDRQQDGLGRHR